MICITTKYHGPTNTKGSRITAKGAKGQQVTIGYHSTDESSDEGKHYAAAKALCVKMGWTGTLVGGSNEAGYTFVFLPRAIAEAAFTRLNDLYTIKSDRGALHADDEYQLGELAYYFKLGQKPY